MKEQLGFLVGLCWKAIFVGKDVIKNFDKKQNKKDKPVRAIHVEIDLQGFHSNFKKLSSHYGTTITVFLHRKLRFYPIMMNIKSDYSAAKLKKAIDRQQSFTDIIMEDYTSAFVGLFVTYNNLPTMRAMR